MIKYAILVFGILFILAGLYALVITIVKKFTCFFTDAKVVSCSVDDSDDSIELWDSTLKFEYNNEKLNKPIKTTKPLEVGKEIGILYNPKKDEVLINKSSLLRYMIVLALGVLLVCMFFFV